MERSLPAVLLSRGNEQIMFDCGEGSTSNNETKTGLHKPLKILINICTATTCLVCPDYCKPWHLWTAKDQSTSMDRGLEQFITCLRETLQFNLTFQVNIHEIANSGIICNEAEYFIEAQHSNHSVNGFCYSSPRNHVLEDSTRQSPCSWRS